MEAVSKLNSFLKKIETNSGKIAPVVAFLADPMADGRGLTGAPGWIMDRIMNWQIPDKATIDAIIYHLSNASTPVGQTFQYSLMAGIAGTILNAIGAGSFHPMLGTVGNLAKKYGFEIATLEAALQFLWMPAVAHSSSPTVKEMLTGSTNNHVKVNDSGAIQTYYSN